MSELRSPHLTDDAIFSAAQWNAAFRGLSRELQEMMLRMLYGDDTPSAGGGGVLGGLVCDNVTGQMQSTVSPGWAWYYDAGLAAPLSPFGVVVLHDTETVTHDAADPTNPRIDVISIASPTGTDTTESVLMWEAAPQNLATQRGAQPTVTVTAGTPAGSPAAPATPSGHLKLAEVLVPAAATNLNSATYTDSRILSRGGYMRDATTAPLVFRNRFALTAFELMEMRGIGASSGSKIQWDPSEDWMAFDRATADAGEQAALPLYPMCTVAGRTWWRSTSWMASGSQPADAAKISWAVAPLGGPFVVERASVATWADQVVLSPPGDVRGVELVAAKVRYQTTTAFDGTINTRSVTLWHIAADGTKTNLGSTNLTLASTHGSVQTATITLGSTPVLAEGDCLAAFFVIDLANDGTAVGAVALHTLDLQFKEGRA